MRICIVGAGAIGGLVGARLAAAGETVSVLARGANLEAISARGLTVIEPDGTQLRAPVAAASADTGSLGPQDVIVLALKAHQLAGIARHLEALYDPDTVVVPMPNPAARPA